MRTYRVEFDREVDGRWIADVPEVPGVLVYGPTQEIALARAQALTLRVLADALEHESERGEPVGPVELAIVGA